MKIENHMKLAMAVLSLGNLAALSAVSADDGELSPLTVVGGKDRALELVGSAAYLDTEDIRNIVVPISTVSLPRCRVCMCARRMVTGIFPISRSAASTGGVRSHTEEIHRARKKGPPFPVAPFRFAQELLTKRQPSASPSRAGRRSSSEPTPPCR